MKAYLVAHYDVSIFSFLAMPEFMYSWSSDYNFHRIIDFDQAECVFNNFSGTTPARPPSWLLL